MRMFPRDAEFATQQLQGILAELQADPALSPLLDDKKLAAAIKEVAANPAALQKHANNPKVGDFASCTRLGWAPFDLQLV